MITRSYITANLSALDRSYRNATSTKGTLFYSKLALLELCGWIEESMDDIVLCCAKRHLKEISNINFVKNETVKRTHGFRYYRHFRKMLIQLFGIVLTEKIERKMDSRKLQLFISALENLTVQRNPEAHTHIKGTMRNINAPSLTIAQFPALYEGLIEFDSTIRKMKFKFY